MHTANACSGGLKCLVDAVEDGFVPAGSESFAADVLFEGSVLLENVEGKSAEGGGDFRCRSCPDATGLLCKNDIQNGVLAVLDRPEIPQQLVE